MKKRVLALLMAAALTLGICVPAFGDEDSYTLTLTNAQPGHTYTAYQIFAGDLHVTDEETVLSNVVWGSGVTETGQTHFGDAAAKAEALEKGGASAVESFAAELASYLNTAAGSVVIPSNATQGSISGLLAGYYLVKTTDVTEEDGVYTYYIMKVVKNTEAKIKADVPSVDKAIVEGGSDHDAVDANIGDAVTFKLTATMPSTFEGYKTYKVVFHDTLSSGLTFDEDSVKVEIFEKDATTGKDVTEFFEVGEEPGELTFTCDNILFAEGVNASPESSIVVTYEATLNSGAEIGDPGNPNKVYLEYSNNPNWDASSAPAGEDEPTGKTPEEKVVVFTYELDVTKTDKGEVNKLQGAEFVLYHGEGSSIEYAQVIDGKLSGWTSNESEASKLTSDSNGFFKVIGLDAGTYYLKETKAPAGYNLIKVPIKLVIAATLNTSEAPVALAKLTISVDDKTAEDGDISTGVVSMTVENNKGPVLPETGGIGTTLFYVVGGALVIGAAVLLVVRRRAAGSEE